MKKIFKVVWVLLMALMITASFVGCAAITGIKGDKGTEGLDYYPLPDGTYGVKMGTAQYLEEVTIPATYNGKAVTKILEHAFTDAENLKIIHIPNSVTSIDYGAFGYCNNLRSITIPNGVTSIGDYVFDNCRGLTSITISSSVTSIGDGALRYCTSLTDVYYTGSETDAEAISFGSESDYLKNATWHYNYVPTEN